MGNTPKKYLDITGGRTLQIDIKKLNAGAIIPARAHPHDAGVDLHACIDSPITIAPHDTVKIGTGLAMKIPVGYVGLIYARSGLATKSGLRPANCVGVCDCTYTGEYIVALHNDSEVNQTVEPFERIAQLVIAPIIEAWFNEVDELEETERGEGGFGSSGKL